MTTNVVSEPRVVGAPISAKDLVALPTGIDRDTKLQLEGNFTKVLSFKEQNINVQKQLVSLGYNIGYSGVDGIWGENTTDALALFQGDRGLQITGFPDPTTLSHLGLTSSFYPMP